MKICYSELIILGNPVLENVDRLIALGADRIELMMDATPWDTKGDNWERLALELAKRPVKFSIHPPAWDTNLVSQIEELREATLQLHKRALQFAHKIGATQMVLHPGFSGSSAFDKAEARARAREITKELAVIAKPLGIRIAFENVGYQGQSIYTFDEYIHALDGIDDIVGYLIDTGHANINGWDVVELIKAVTPRLCGLHIHDNTGKNDAHLPIYKGTLPWDELFNAMKLAPENCEFVLEYTPGTPIESLVEGKRILLDKVGK